MPEDTPEHEPVEAEVVHEAQEVPPPQEAPLARRKIAVVPRRKPFFNLTTMLVLLVFVGSLAFLLRGKLTETYERYVVAPVEKPGSMERVQPEDENGRDRGDADQQESSDDYDVRMPPPRSGHVDEEEDAVPPPIRPYLPEEGPPGIAYSIVDRRDRSYGNVSRWEMKVLIPKGASREDVLRCARDIVRTESKKRVYHALQFYFFDTPGDADELDPARAVAKVVWAPLGRFGLAERALTESTQINRFELTMKP